MSAVKNAIRHVGTWESLGDTCALLKIAGVTVAVCHRKKAHRKLTLPWYTEILGNKFRTPLAPSLESAKELAEKAVAVDLSCILSAIDKA